MKNPMTALAALLITAAGYSQPAFDIFEDQEGVTTLVVTRNMFKMMSKMDVDEKDEEVQQYKELIDNLENIKMYITEDVKLAGEMKDTFDKYIKSTPGVEELMRVIDDKANVRFYTREGKDEYHVSEFLMFVSDFTDKTSEAVLMRITGNIDLRMLSKIANKLNIPGSEHLEGDE